MADENGNKVANPAPLGLAGFGITTVLLSLIKAHVLPDGGDVVVIPRANLFSQLGDAPFRLNSR